MSDLKVQGEVSFDTSSVDKAFGNVEQRAKTMAQNVGQAGDQAGRAVEGIGNGGSGASTKVDAASRSMIASIQRATAAMDAGSKSSREYYEVLAKQRGIDPSVLRPYLDQLDEVTAKQKQAESATSAASAAFEAYGGPISRAYAEVSRFSGSLSGATRTIVGFTAAAVGIGVLESAMYSLVRPMAEVQAQVDRINVGLKFANGGSAAAGARDLQFLREEANRLGIDLTVAANSFVKLSSAARETSLEGKGARDVFVAISEAAAVMHLSAAETEGALLAINQMISKGTVQSEELRGQLGERLPGAFQIAARAMGVTTAELGKMLEQGEVIASDFLPKFAAQVRKELAGSVEEAANSTQAALGRIDSAWAYLKRTVADSGLGQAAAGQMNILTDAMNDASSAIRRAKAEGAGFWGQFSAGAGAGLSFLNPANAFSYQAKSLKGMQQQRGEIEAQLKDTSLDTFQRGQLAYNLTQLDKRIAEAQRLADAENRRTPPNLSDVMGLGNDVRLQTEAESRTRKFLEDGKNLTKAENRDKNLKEIEDDFKAATAGLERGSGLYNQAVAAAAARKRKVWDDYNKADASAGARDGQNALNASLAEFEGYAKERLEILKGDERNLESMRKRGVLTERDYAEQLYQLRDNALVDQIAIAERQSEIAGGKKQLSAQKKYLGEVTKLETERTNAARAYADTLGELDAAAARRYNDDSLRAYDAAAKETEAIRLKLRAAEEEFATMGMSAQQIAEVTRARTLETAAAKDSRAAILDSIPGREEEAAQLREQAKLLRELADQQVVNGARKDFVENWKKGADEINRSLTDALLRGFESGKGFGRNLVDTLKNMFQSLVLRPVISAVLAPVSGAVSSMMGVSGAVQAGSSGFSLLNAASNGSSVYSALTAGSVSLPGVVAAPIAEMAGGDALGNLIALKGAGVGGATPGVAGFTGAMNAAAGVGIGYGLGSLISGQYAAFGNNQAWASGGGAAIGAAIGSIVPGIGTLIGGIAGGVIGGVVNRAFGMGPKNYGEKGFEGTVDATGFHGQMYADWSQKGGWFRSNRKGTDYSQIDPTQLTGLNAQFAGMVSTYSGLNQVAGTPAFNNNLGGFSYRLRNDWSTPENVAKSVTALADALGSHLVPGIADFQKQGESLLDTATRLTTVFTVTNQVATVFGKDIVGVFGSVGLASTNLRQQLVDAAGGLDAFTSQLSSYYDAYYSEAEKQQRTLQALSEKFAEMGVALPQSKEAFRALVEGQNLTTDAGQRMYTLLMQIAPAFAQVTDAMAAFGKQVAAVQQSLRLGNLSTLTPEQQYAEAKRQYDATSSAAQSGDSAAQSQWAQVAQAFLEASRSFFASGVQYAVDFAAVQGFRPNGSHADGLAYVPFDGYVAELHQGERVLTRAENTRYSAAMPDWSQYGRGDNAALVAEIRSLSAEVATLRETLRQVELAKEAQADARHAEALAVQTKQVRLQQQLVDK